jgi:hypothetical protein
MRRASLCVQMIATFLFAAVAAHPAAAESALAVELKALAKDLKETLDKRSVSKVSLGNFTARKKLAATGGPGVEKLLADQLRALGLTIDDRADFEITGFYQDKEDPENGLLAVLIHAELRDGSGKVLLDVERLVHGQEATAVLLGTTGEFPPRSDPRKRSEELKKQLDRPEVDLERFRVRAAAGNPYAVEMHVKQNGKYTPREATAEGGRAFVPVKRDEAFGVLLVNDSPHEAAVSLHLDGLSMFTFSKNQDYSFVIVPPKSSYRVEGWHFSNDESREFVVREYPSRDEAKFKLKQRGELGAITTCFSVAWADDSKRPEGFTPRGGKDFVDVGNVREDIKFKEVKRFVGNVVSTITVRYQK